jgi:hypothetical protein
MPRMLRRLCVSSMTRRRHRNFTQGGEHAIALQGDAMTTLMQELARQRWDDHRYYHHCRINQSLHLISALSFVAAYVLLFIDPALAAVVGWCVSMITRQAGHFFFEPRGYDQVNAATDEHKEAIKVGYNIRRKIVLMTVWAAVPLLVWLGGGSWRDVGIAWLALGVAGLLFRVAQLALTQNWRTALAWMLKILTDPFHDIVLYHRAPLALLRGERYDPMHHVRQPR